MSRLFFILTVFFFALPALAQEQDTIRVTLASAIERSLDISPEVWAKQARTDFSIARYSQARASRFLTEFSATSAHALAPAIDNPNGTPRDRLYLDPQVRNDWQTLSPFNRIEFEAIQPIWTWGELSGSLAAARAGIDVDRAGTRTTELSVAVRTAEIYYSLLLMEALSRLTSEAGDILERAKKEIDRLIEEGAEDVDYADLFQVQITEQEFIERRLEVKERRLTARAALSRQMFLADSETIALQDRIMVPIDFVREPLEIYQQLALTSRAELDQTSAGVLARNALVDVARADYYPKFFLGITGKWSYAANRERQRNPYISDPFLSRGIRAGFGLRQNLNFGQTRSKVQQAQAQAAEVRFQGDAVRQLILFEVEEAFRNLVIAEGRLEARNQALLISKKWLRDEEISFDLEIGDTENLVKAVRENLSQRAQKEQAIYSYNLSVIRLLEKTGSLILALEAGTLVGL